MNRPITIDGTPVMTSAMKRITLAMRLLPPVLVEVDRGEHAERDRHERGDAGDHERADDRRRDAAARELRDDRQVLGEEAPADDAGALADHVDRR